jgi:glycosyltransferase involved in cell wall biosynthesis
MTEPLVCCVMLTKDRPEMAKRAIECFRSQTYQNKRLYVYDTGTRPCADSLPDGFPDHSIVYHRGLDEGITIGMLRNRANWWAVRPHAEAPPNADILIHWDDDDWSHPNRISEQVALLQASRKQVCGYRDMLFWRTGGYTRGEAWLYTNNDPRYCLGTSLCYYRSVWERRPFPNESRGEDKEWLREVESLGETSLFRFSGPSGSGHNDLQPRMIASIHSGNHVVYQPEKQIHNYTRVPEWDEHCRKVMSLCSD